MVGVRCCPLMMFCSQVYEVTASTDDGSSTAPTGALASVGEISDQLWSPQPSSCLVDDALSTQELEVDAAREAEAQVQRKQQDRELAQQQWVHDTTLRMQTLDRALDQAGALCKKAIYVGEGALEQADDVLKKLGHTITEHSFDGRNAAILIGYDV